MGTTAEDLAFEKSQAEQEAWGLHEETYQIYRDAFEVALTDSLVQAARSRSHEIYIEFRTELQSAKEAVEEAAGLVAAGGIGSFDPLLVSWLRAYSATEWYHSELGA